MLDTVVYFANTYVFPFVIRLLCAIIVLLIGMKLSKTFIKHITKRAFFSRLDPNMQALIKNSIHILLNTLIIIVAVEILGVPGATIVTVLGSCGLAVGLALQGGLSNLAGGVMIMLFKPFHVGDFIITDAGCGTVDDIGIFYTKLTTMEHTSISIPNSTISNISVSNVSAYDTRRIDLNISISYEADIDTAKELLLSCTDAEALALREPAPRCVVSAHDSSSVSLTLFVWVKSENFLDVKFSLLESTKKALDMGGISIPYPQLDVHVKNDK
ncbi:MAG: mechanosensitive ion channel [Clostridiales bacterium]|nr:mechanosensitive ion channel [Clostridiales bacterium]